MRVSRSEVERLQKELAALEKRVVELERQLVPMADAVHRYKRTPFDKLYMLGRRIKDFFILRKQRREETRKARLKESLYTQVQEEKFISPDATIEEIEHTPIVWPSITVIIPTYKQNEYLEQCVSSVLEQDYEPDKIEIIISVNGKDAEFAEWLTQRYVKEERIRVIYTPIPGLSSGRNYAKQYIRTDFVTYLDDDDYFTKGYLRELAAHVTPEVSVVCGRMVDFYDDGTIDADTYINRALGQAGEGYYTDYLKLGSLFSSAWAKLYRTIQVTEIWGDFDESVVHTEDIIFWVENIYKPLNKIYTCQSDGTEALVRRLRENSMSRPNAEKQFAFYITDRVALIERFTKALFVEDRTLNYKRFVLTKIDANIQIMLKFFRNCSLEGQNAARDIIYENDCPFINRSLFAEKKAIAFCHNFSPASDASAYVASKRLTQIDEYIGEPLNWKVICADMTKQRVKDFWWDMFYGKYHYTEKIITHGATYFNEEAQQKWGEAAFELVKNEEAAYIYSRSCWTGSHVAARLYKQKHPETIWIAEFSDPVYMGTDNCERPVAKEYSGEKKFLNTFWRDLERYVFDEADKIIFTNENQKIYMLDCNAGNNRAEIEGKAIVWHHPRVSAQYASIIQSDYIMDKDRINIGYFGTFYANRSVEPIFDFLKNPNVNIHIFTTVTEELKEKTRAISNRIYLHSLVSHLEFLNLAKRMDYLFLNDIKFSGSITPYLPSKLADYLSVGTTVIAQVYPNTPMSNIEDKNLIKISTLDDFFIKNIRKREEGKIQVYRSDIASIEDFQDEFAESMSREVIISAAENLKSGIADCGFKTLDKPAMYNEEGNIIWDFSDEQTAGSRNTFYLYFRGLRPLYLLACAYEDSGDISFLKLANRILTSFYQFFATQSLKAEMLFNDHAQAERIQNIVFLWDVAKGARFELNTEAAIALVTDAVEKLSGIAYYQSNHNHGIIVDKACLIGLYFLNKPDFVTSFNYIVERLKLQVDYAFTSDGIHKENSIDYHYFVLSLLSGIKNILQYAEHPYFVELSEKMKGAEEYIIYSLKPNLKRPLFGDSKGEQIKYIKKHPDYIKTYDNPYMEYVVTQGKRGECPPSLFKKFSSGYIFMREHFNSANFQESTWISFKAGFSTRVHKHMDDLSVCLFTKGYDVFVDPGMYSFSYGDYRKNYMESPEAHSIICVKDKAYNIASGKGYAFKIQRAQSRPNYDYAMASSRGYDGTAVYRHLYYLRQMNVLVIRDECISNEVQTYAQYFHLGPKVYLPEDANRDYTRLSIGDTPYVVTLQQLNSADGFAILNGEKTSPMSLMSAGFNSCFETNTLEYTKKATTTVFTTVIDIHRHDDSPCKAAINDSTLIIEKLGRKIELPFEKGAPVSFGNISTEISGKNNLTISNETSHFSKHTVYIFNNKNGYVTKLPYTGQKQFSVDLSGINDATIVYFVANETGETLNGLLGNWDYDESKGTGIFNQYSEVLSPKQYDTDIDRETAPEYLFRINADNRLNADISWWIYRNGSLYDYIKNEKTQFKVRLDTPGEYVIMCSMRNKYFGEFFFHQFDKVVVE